MPLIQLGLPCRLFRRGKVRDTYDLGDDLLIVATDRISAFDVVLPTPIPGKGEILTQLSRILVRADPARSFPTISLIQRRRCPTGVTPASRSVDWACDARARRRERIDVECVVRGYLAGSAWNEYRRTANGRRHRPARRLRQSAQLPGPHLHTGASRTTPGTTRTSRSHELRELVGGRPGRESRADAVSRSMPSQRGHAPPRGIIIADTKFEFGLIDGELHADRRTADSGQLPILGRRRPTHRARIRPASTSSTCATGSIESGWNKNHPRPALAG